MGTGLLDVFGRMDGQSTRTYFSETCVLPDIIHFAIHVKYLITYVGWTRRSRTW